MGLLDKLWDDTLAGPQPESGLGKLRKFSSFNFRSNTSKESDGGTPRSYDDNIEETTRVTRRIMIVKPPGYQNNGSPPISPAGSTPPVSPFSGGRETFGFRRRSTSDAYEKSSRVGGSRSPSSSYDV